MNRWFRKLLGDLQCTFLGHLYLPTKSLGPGYHRVICLRCERAWLAIEKGVTPCGAVSLEEKLVPWDEDMDISR